MDDSAFTQTCVCGRAYADIGAFTRHEKTCRKGKKRLSGALARVKEIYNAKRARRRAPSPILGSFADGEVANTSSTTCASELFEDQPSCDPREVCTYEILLLCLWPEFVFCL
jgi:hypothetical protein